eukprot:gene1362-2633_t
MADGKQSIMRRTTATAVENSTIDTRTKISARRGAFLFMPILCSNDVVHGSWWFVWGSFVSMIFPVLILLNPYIHIYDTEESTLPALGYYVTWIMLIISGLFFTVGSFFFVRAFEEPPVEPLFKQYKHIQTDELLAAWLFLFGTMPAVPYSTFWFIYRPTQVIYLASLVASGTFVFCAYLFVLACYPSDKKHKQVVKPVVRIIFGRNHWIIKHVQNDWLAGTWFFFLATFMCLFGSVLLFLDALVRLSNEEMFIYGLSVFDFLLFLIGCIYFVSGSYPDDKNKCYKKRKQSIQLENGDIIEQEIDTNEVIPIHRKYDPREIENDDEDDDFEPVSNIIHTNVNIDNVDPSRRINTGTTTTTTTHATNNHVSFTNGV